jgi:hypothetical protein
MRPRHTDSGTGLLGGPLLHGIKLRGITVSPSAVSKTVSGEIPSDEGSNPSPPLFVTCQVDPGQISRETRDTLGPPGA